MADTFSFRLLCGKNGAAGHIRTEGADTEIFCRGLVPGLMCTLYRDGKVEGSCSVSAQGTVSFTCSGNGFFFLCHEDVLLLWEAEKDRNQNYFRARRLMPEPRKTTGPLPPEKQESSSRHTDSAFPQSAPEEKEPILQPLREEAAQDKEPLLTPLPETPPQAPPLLLPLSPEPSPADAPVLSPVEDAALPLEAPLLLRTPSDAPSVHTLPPLHWPAAVCHLQSAFRSGIPFRPFAAPGFRCIRLPAQNPALPYCILGYQAKNGRVCALLHAVPGHPLLPPRGFRADQYREGHFIRIQPLPAPDAV